MRIAADDELIRLVKERGGVITVGLFWEVFG